MKRLFGIGLIALVGLQAYAQDAAPAPAAPPTSTSKVVIRMRFDSLNRKIDTKKDDFTNAGVVTPGSDVKTGLSGFKLVKSDIAFTNQLGDAKVYIRLNPTFASWAQESTSMGGSGLANFLDIFWVDQPIFDGLRLKAGKLDYALASGVENIIATSHDYYIKSYYLATYVGPDPLGFNLDYTFNNQKIELQVVNGLPTEASLVNGNAATTQSYDTNGGITVALGYFGDFGWVKPVITLGQVKYAQNIYTITDSKGNNQTDYHNDTGRTSYSLGGVFNVAGASIMAEYDGMTIKKFDAILNGADQSGLLAGSSELTLNTIVVDVRYPVGAFTPFIKVTSDNQKISDTANDKLTQTGLSGGLWYAVTPTGRINLAYANTQKITKSDLAAKVTTTTEDYVLGASLKI